MKNKQATSSFVPLLIIDVLVFALLGLIIAVVNFCYLKRVALPNMSEASMLGLGSTVVFIALFGFVFYLFVEYKYNRLKFKNIFLYLGVIIAIGNLIAVCLLPSEMPLPNDTILIITPMVRAYYVFSGLFYALLPYLCMYLIPRRVTSRHYLDIILYVVIGFAALCIILSFITDWDSYVHYLENPSPIGSIIFHKNGFGLVLIAGMFSSIAIRIRHRNWKWSLFLIPFYLFLLLSLAKTAMFVGTLMILIYLIVRLVLVCKKSKDNLIITLLIVGFCLVLSPLFIIGIIRSESGILFHVKEFFVSLAEGAKTTFSSRMLIWESAIQLLSSWRVIFGYGVNSFGMALHLVYTKITPYEFDPLIFIPHNLVLHLLGNGGIILLGIYIFIYGYLIRAAFKVRNKMNHWFIDATLIFLLLFTILGIVEDSHLCNANVTVDFIPSQVIICCIMSEYYLVYDKDEVEIRKDMVKSANSIKKVHFKSKLLNLNKKRLIYDAKYIAYDLNSKIKL